MCLNVSARSAPTPPLLSRGVCQHLPGLEETRLIRCQRGGVTVRVIRYYSRHGYGKHPSRTFFRKLPSVTPLQCYYNTTMLLQYYNTTTILLHYYYNTTTILLQRQGTLMLMLMLMLIERASDWATGNLPSRRRGAWMDLQLFLFLCFVPSETIMF